MEKRKTKQYTHNMGSLTLNNYIFRIFLMIMIASSIVSIAGNVITNFPMIANVKWVMGIGIFTMGLWLLKKDYLVELFKFGIFMVSISFIILPSWFYGGGDNIITLMYLFMVSVEAFLMFEKEAFKWIIAIVSIASAVTLLTITYKLPNLIQAVPTGQNVFVDTLIQISIIFIIMIVSISIYTKQYIKQHRLLKEANVRLELLASIDELSGIFNRRKILGMFDEIFKNKAMQSVYIAMLDIDLFKSINDTYGHVIGDNAIKHIAEHITNAVGDNGYAGRYGGDEFIIILCNMTDDEISDFGEKLLKVPKFHEIQITVSAGIARHTDEENADALIKRADDLLVNGKKYGKNKAWFWNAN